MVDYRCPSCDGGFPAPADACPWCGETMADAGPADVPEIADRSTINLPEPPVGTLDRTTDDVRRPGPFGGDGDE